MNTRTKRIKRKLKEKSYCSCIMDYDLRATMVCKYCAMHLFMINKQYTYRSYRAHCIFCNKDNNVMRICDLPEDKIVVGMRIRSLVFPHTKLGTIVKIEPNDDNYAWIHWDGNDKAYGGFYGNNCECEVVTDE